jgi:hypothetical protein
VPFEAKAEYGSARAPVRCTINGVEYRSRLSVYRGRTFLGLSKEVPDAAGVSVGDKQYARWIAGAERQERRERRVRKAIEMLSEGIKHP